MKGRGNREQQMGGTFLKGREGEDAGGAGEVRLRGH